MANIFISYKSGPTDEFASALYKSLSDKGHRVFLDREQLGGGSTWDETIYREIGLSDVLIVLITEDALESRWVQREVDYARGCRIEILPVVVRDEDLRADPATGLNKVSKVMSALALNTIQYAKTLASSSSEFRFAEVEAAIKKRAPQTRSEQLVWLKELDEKWKLVDKADPNLNPPKSSNPRFARYAFIQANLQPHVCEIYLAAGDITHVRNIDVLVNSENVYMQMQRVFAPSSVSKTIRLAGAKRHGIYIEEDTIQQELDTQIYAPNGPRVPVAIGDVFMTSAGSPQSELSRQGIHYVFHVAAVNAYPDEGELRLNDSQVIKTCVLNCFAKVSEINAQSPQSPIQSIIFPMLGTGNAGLNLSDAAEAMIDGIKEYLTDNPSTALRAVHLAAFTLRDIEVVKGYLAQNFHPL